MSSRQEVYAVIDQERDYQDAGRGNAKTDRKTVPVGDGIALMRAYATRAEQAFADFEPGRAEAMEIVRKITTLGVLVMEHNGMIPRGGKALFMGDRAAVYQVVDGERDYQDGLHVTHTHLPPTVGEGICLISTYLDKAQARFARLPDGREAALEQVREVTAIGVLIMEHRGAPPRFRHAVHPAAFNPVS